MWFQISHFKSFWQFPIFILFFCIHSISSGKPYGFLIPVTPFFLRNMQKQRLFADCALFIHRIDSQLCSCYFFSSGNRILADHKTQRFIFHNHLMDFFQMTGICDLK